MGAHAADAMATFRGSTLAYMPKSKIVSKHADVTDIAQDSMLRRRSAYLSRHMPPAPCFLLPGTFPEALLLPEAAEAALWGAVMLIALLRGAAGVAAFRLRQNTGGHSRRKQVAPSNTAPPS